jgi:predicted Fe-S protein YdhL (DUF1289 family)
LDDMNKSMETQDREKVWRQTSQKMERWLGTRTRKAGAQQRAASCSGSRRLSIRWQTVQSTICGGKSRLLQPLFDWTISTKKKMTWKN